MKRVITLINQLASASTATAALQLQADSASTTAKKYMEDNELLKQVRRLLSTPAHVLLHILWLLVSQNSSFTDAQTLMFPHTHLRWRSFKFVRVFQTLMAGTGDKLTAEGMELLRKEVENLKEELTISGDG